ncbi:hypothetical protein D9M70_586440 [compost metagenome]
MQGSEEGRLTGIDVRSVQLQQRIGSVSLDFYRGGCGDQFARHIDSRLSPQLGERLGILIQLQLEPELRKDREVIEGAAKGARQLVKQLVLAEFFGGIAIEQIQGLASH